MRPDRSPSPRGRVRLWRLVLLGGMAGLGCAGSGATLAARPVEFTAPGLPDGDLAHLLEGVERIGVLSATNIEPVQGLDVVKVMGRLSDATARGLESLPGRAVVTQDEIRWHFRDAAFDSAAVFGDSLRKALREEMDLDALVHVTLRRLQAQLTPVSPTPYGAVPSPGVNLSVELQLVLLNLHSGERWSQEGRRSSWQPMQIDLLGGGRDRTEQQLLEALSGPLRQFLERVAPPPTRQTRQFDVSGD